MNPLILDIIEDDGRLELIGDITTDVSIETLQEYQHDENIIIREEAKLALSRRQY